MRTIVSSSYALATDSSAQQQRAGVRVGAFEREPGHADTAGRRSGPTTSNAPAHAPEQSPAWPTALAAPLRAGPHPL
ncbi:MAG TPA: hypothetical protein VEJ84_00895, partial [Acidimicrobiales bacterium]|nr:hypothetical protein [Acidimicrobiales bacterium]